MDMKRMGRRMALAAVCLLATGAALVQTAAAQYPNRPVRMIVPFAPGGASDHVGRIIQPKLSEALGQQVVIDNRTGAGGGIGVEVAARASADGYTILLGNVGSIVINPGMFPKLPVRPLRDFIAITQVVDVAGALVAHPSVPAATVKDFIAYAKSRAGVMNYGSSGAGSAQRLEMESFMRAAGINLVHVPYKGGAGAVAAALVSGEVSATMTSVASVMPHVKVGRIKMLGVAVPKRLALLPDTPTMAESGFPDMTTGSWQGVYVPAGTPRPVVDRLFAVVTRIMGDPEVVSRLAQGGAEVILSKSPEDFAVFMKTQTARWAKVIKETGIVGE